jgi:peptidoglycan/LPS O-acetylase OafA/YrhL
MKRDHCEGTVMTWLTATIGWAAAVSMLAAYLLLLRHRTSADSRLYLSLNFLGSAGLAVSTSAAHAWPSAAVNLIWLAIGLAPLVRALLKFHARRRCAGTTANADPQQT